MINARPWAFAADSELCRLTLSGVVYATHPRF